MKYSRLFLIAFVAAFTVSCSKETNVTPNLSVEIDEIRLTAFAQSIDIKVNTNVDFDVEVDQGWLSAQKTYTVELSTISISVIQNNETEHDRTGVIRITPNGSKEETLIKVIQEANGIIQVDDKHYYITSDAQDIIVGFESNYDYSVIIPDDAKKWIGIENNSNTKAVLKNSLTLSIGKNEEYVKRKSDVILLLPTYNSSDTIHITQEEGFESIRKLLRKNIDCSIFYNALVLTGLEDSIMDYYDYSYPPVQFDSTYSYFSQYGKTPYRYNVGFETDYAIWPDKRVFKYTLFVEPDKLFNDNGITSIDELRIKAEQWYPDYPEFYDDLTNRNNSLNRFIAYHILPMGLSYDKLNLLEEEITENYKKWSLQDVEDFYETMLPHSSMRVSTPYVDKNHRYINRKGIEGDDGFIPGIMVLEPNNIETSSLNGIIHYVDDILLYSNYVREEVLNTRMRIMASTLSPDFINSGAHGRYGGKGDYNPTKDRYVVGFKQNYCKNFYFSDKTEFYVRYRDSGFPIYMGDETLIRGNYDIAFKLPPVPFDGIYEIRFPMNTMEGYLIGSDRGIAQFYYYEGISDILIDEWTDLNWKPCGTPFDMSLRGDDASIGNVMDHDSSIGDDEAKIQANEKAMRELGYMKAPNSYYGGSKLLRDDLNNIRKIICNEYMQSDMEHYIRIKKIDTDINTVCPFGYIEVVPYSVYSGDNGPEDRH